MQHEFSKGRRFRGRLVPLVASALLQERRWWVFFVALDDVDEKRAEEKIDNFFQKVAQQGSVW